MIQRADDICRILASQFHLNVGGRLGTAPACTAGYGPEG
jgi:hypothetical protein